MITLSEDKLIEILLCFEMQINKEKAELLEKKRQEWNILEKSMSDPFTEIDYNKLTAKELKSICKGKTAIIYCQSGKRSCKAIIELKKYGIKAINLKGGIDQWECEKER